MGFISRRVLPVCGHMCICCPALRSRSRQPVKRYKKLLAEIFPRSPDGPPNERKIVKLCEYAAKNPFRIPKIAKYLEQRIYKELRSSHIKFVDIIMEAYNRLLSMCREQMAYFAVSVLNVVIELLDNSKQDAIQILGCKTLTNFIYSQTDSTYAHNIESLVHQVCTMAGESGEGDSKRCLKASSLQCISAMVWFMSEFSYVFADFDKIVHAVLDNYELDEDVLDNERGESHHNWVNEVVRSEARAKAGDLSPCYMAVRPRPEKKDPSLLTREETETPAIWAQICIQKIVELAKESTTLCRVLDPMFIYFDMGRHWIPRRGLALTVLSDMSYFAESWGKEQLILSAAIRHLDHKNVAHDPQVKSDIFIVATALARQIRSRAVVAEMGILSDLCRHLRKSLQATVENAGQQEANMNILLQNSIKDCLVEIVKGVSDAQILFDMMAITMEKLPPNGTVARATIGSMLILAHIISLASFTSHLQQVFPEALLIQILKAMIHPDAETRVGAHQIFDVLLIPSFKHHRSEFNLLRSGYLNEAKRWQSKAASALASATALLDKLRREKDGETGESRGNDAQIEYMGKELEDEWKQGPVHRNSPNLCSITSIIDRTAGSASSMDTDLNIVKLSEDQTAQLLSAFWIESTIPDNMPSNFEAIAHSFNLAIISSRLRNGNQNCTVRFFQLPLSLRKISLDHDYGILPPSCQRSIYTLATGMLMFLSKIYHIPSLQDFLKSLVPYDIDPYVGISDDLQVYVKPQANVREYGSASDRQAALHTLSDLRLSVQKSDREMMDILLKFLPSVVGLEPDELTKQLSEAFSPDDALFFGQQSRHGLDHFHAATLSRDSFSFDGDIPSNIALEDDATSELSTADPLHFMPKFSSSPTAAQIISVGQLLESALEVAGQVAGASISNSPLPYSAMARQCEALGKDSRKKLSSWLAHESNESKLADGLPLTILADRKPTISEMISDSEAQKETVLSSEQPWMGVRLPPASPFDNFLKAAGC